jgi:hypothetical protein
MNIKPGGCGMWASILYRLRKIHVKAITAVKILPDSPDYR